MQPLKKNGLASSRTSSLITKFAKRQRASCSRLAPISPDLLMKRSLRYWGLNPSGSPAEPAGKEQIVAIISDGDTMIELTADWIGSSGLSKDG